MLCFLKNFRFFALVVVFFVRFPWGVQALLLFLNLEEVFDYCIGFDFYGKNGFVSLKPKLHSAHIIVLPHYLIVASNVNLEIQSQEVGLVVKVISIPTSLDEYMHVLLVYNLL